ncbi:MAG TPA: sigma-70 family RNA polymerase sigma factor [Pyrinomonadaceae bacterium]|nr:sigma-70 family RNA polymerase sigma factor [Pyrinomonadaceae bacterium]
MDSALKATNFVALSGEQREIAQDAAARLVNRARNSRNLTAADLQPRIAATLEKYLLRDNPEAGEQKIREFIESLQIDDLCLVAACERGDDAAWQDLFANFGGAVKSAARSVTSNPDAAEDLAQSIWAELHGLKTDQSGKPSGKLGYYSGRGSLAGWLRAVVSQLAIDAHRKQSRMVQIEEPREFENLAHENETDERNIFAHTENPEQSYASREAARTVEESLIKALAELDAEDRLLIKLYYFDGLRLKQAGAVLGFHEATASRRLTRIHTDLRKRVEKILEREKGWKRDEIERNLAEAGEKLDTNLEKLIASVPKVQEN